MMFTRSARTRMTVFAALAAISVSSLTACAEEEGGAATPTSVVQASARANMLPPTAAPERPTPTPPAPLEIQLTEINQGEVITVQKGASIVVALASNPSTGLSWWVRDLPAQLQLDGEPAFVPAGSTEPVPGAAGTEVFRFAAAESGRGNLVLQYAQSFASKDPEDVYAITVVVGEEP